MSEIAIQAEVFQYIWNHYEETRGFMFHVPNGGKRTKIEASQLKASGVVAGIPDLLYISIHTLKLYPVEMKKPGGVLSPEQVKIIAKWRAKGITVMVYDNVQDAINYYEGIIRRNE